MANYWNFRNKNEDDKPEIVLRASAAADRILLFNILNGRYGTPRIAEGKSKDGTAGELVIDFDGGGGSGEQQAFTIPDYDSEKTYNSGDVVSAEVGEVRGIYRSDVDGNALAPGEAMGWNFYDEYNPHPSMVTTDYVPETLYNPRTRIRVPLSEIGISGSGHFVAIVGGGLYQLLVGVELMNKIKDYVLTGIQHTGVFLTRSISGLASEEGIHLYVNSNNKLLKIHDYSPESSYMQHLVEDYYGALEFPISSELVAEINESMSAVAVKVDNQYFINVPDAVSETNYIQNESSPGDVGPETWTLLATAAFGGGGGLPGDPFPPKL